MKSFEVHATSDGTVQICKHIKIAAVSVDVNCGAGCQATEILQVSCAPCRRKFEIAVHSMSDRIRNIVQKGLN